MVTVADGLFGVGALVSLGICWLAYVSYQRWDEPGSTAFVAFVGLLGAGSLAGGVTSIVFGTTRGGAAVWTQLSILFLAFWVVPWALFGLQYAGRFTRVRWRTVGALYAPVIGVVPFLLVEGLTGDTEPSVAGQLAGSLLFVYLFILLALGLYLVGLTTYRYGHLSAGQGATLIAVPLGHFLIGNMTSSITETLTDVEIALLHIFGAVVPALCLLLALFRYDTFESTPAVGEIGERAIARETDDLVFILDDNGRVIKLNESSLETLDVSRRYSLGASLPAVIDYGIERFREQDTVTLETVDGTRQYDVQVTSITDQHDRRLGTMLSLRDVTERELREQRLSVLNRVLRHNLRNKIEVIKAHTEVLDDHGERVVANGGHTEIITDTADEIAQLGERARAIDRFVSTSTGAERVDIVATIQETLDTLGAADHEVSVTRHLPESATVTTNREALRAAIESALDNALTYADARASVAVSEERDSYLVSIVDDGPGIPDAELAAIEEGTETPLQHGTGLGLWQLRWAVTTIGGELSFETDGGTTVEIRIPANDS